ncbi:MAG: hypothetical protein A3I66_11860 [Burkholderiales bacterium RIFCSPLOWO2_02_FULL_57_36]|nr:MAG: hypothetical protein A3I66_11860 [Burkholderiales bacterium RIFCSPLOWO2_02_FULL_57_36]
MAENTNESLVYAALEFRCGVEARLKEYIQTIDHIPKAQKKEWAVAKLGRSLQSAYRTGDKMMVFTIVFPEDGAELQLLYTPVTKRLQDIAQRAGDFLHALREELADQPGWWHEFRQILHEGYPLLELANSGELIGLPLLHRPTKRIDMRAVLLEGDSRYPLVSRLQAGCQHILHVAYIDPIPGTFTYYEG